MDGWIKLHRKMTEWEWYDDPGTRLVFLHLLLIANYEDKNWRGITIKRGQALASIGKLSRATGLSIQQTRNKLTNIQTTGEVTSKSTNKYTIYTLQNYETYQTNNKQTNKQTTSKPTTTKEYKEDKNILPNGNMVKDQYGNKYVEYVLEAFKKNVGAYPIEDNRRNIAHNIVQITGTFIKKHGDKYLASRGTQPTFTSLIDKSWIIYSKNNEGTTTRRLKTFKQHYKFMLEKLESELSTL